jgi:hypothetical protein
MPEHGYESRPVAQYLTFRELFTIWLTTQWMNEVYVKQIEQNGVPVRYREPEGHTVIPKGALDTVNATLDKDPNERP